MSDTLTLADIKCAIAYARERHIEPHPDGCYHLAIPDERVQSAFEAGLAPFCPVYMPEVVAIGGLTVFVDGPGTGFKGYWEGRDAERREERQAKKKGKK